MRIRGYKLSVTAQIGIVIVVINLLVALLAPLIAPFDQATPVVCVATRSPVLEKLLSNIQEARARGAYLIAVTTADDGVVEPHVDATIAVPATDWMLQPILAVIPLQLLAYAIARKRGLNVDQPRNLAKTVTVE